MDNTTLGTTTLEHIPSELLHTKRKTNRLWTLIIIVIVIVLFGAFWAYRNDMIMQTAPTVVPVVASEQAATQPPDSMADLEATLMNTEIPAYSETL